MLFVLKQEWKTNNWGLFLGRFSVFKYHLIFTGIPRHQHQPENIASAFGGLWSLS